MKIAVVGATGLVGSVILDVLAERKFPVKELIPVATAKSVGKEIHFKKKKIKVVGIKEAIEERPDIAIFSAGGTTSRTWAPKFVDVGTTVIDNSSAWRMFHDIRLIVPEINAHILTEKDKIIANPNCSTIQMVVPLAALHKKYKINRLVVSTYQAVTGSGLKAVNQLKNERNNQTGEMAYPHPIDLNCLPHGGEFEGNGYTAEETKLVNETRKILHDDGIHISPTVVRIPVFGGHSESVNVEFHNAFNIIELRKLLRNTEGVTVLDNPLKNEYPTPLIAEGKDDIFIGRIRRDYSKPNALNLWIVSDNLRKGAATNAVQIAEYLIENGLVK